MVNYTTMLAKDILSEGVFKLLFGASALYSGLIDTLDRYQINTPLRIAHFLAQTAHESGDFKALSENLNYSADGLLKTFPKYFNSASAAKYERKPQAIASRVYANRGGNGDEASGDGWRYRGRGALQVTMKDNYKALSKSTGIDFVTNPDLASSSQYAFLSAGWYWDQHNLNTLADANKLDSISDIVNIGHTTVKVGDSNGFSNRKDRLDKYIKLLV